MSGQSKAHVVCCNDAVVAVVLGTEAQADLAMEQFVVEDYQRSRWHFNNSSVEYLNRCYWHIHTVGLVIADRQEPQVAWRG